MNVAMQRSAPVGRRFFGAGFIAGQLPGLVRVSDVPAAREVECRHRVTREVVAVTFSTPAGTYRFDWVDPAQQFDAHGRDWRGIYNDDVVSRIRPRAYGAV